MPDNYYDEMLMGMLGVDATATASHSDADFDPFEDKGE